MTTLTMRDRLVDTALNLCYQHGFHAIGVDHIAKEAGTTRATLYNHFESKDDLALAVVAKRDAWWQETFSSEIKRRGGDDPLAQLRSVPEILREWFASDGFNGCLFINTASEFPSPHDPIHKAAKANVDAIRSIITAVAARAGIQDAETFAGQFNMIIEGTIVTEVIDRDGSAPDTAAQLTEALIEHHLRRTDSFQEEDH
jgi:AcrR family transcriptional regulator